MPLRDRPAGTELLRARCGRRVRTIAPAVTHSCTATPDCFQIFVSVPLVRPAPHWDASFTETLNVASPAKVWTLHVGDTFSDVPR